METKKKAHAKYLNYLDPDQTEKPTTAKFSDEQNCHFKPQINPISDALMNKKKIETGVSGPWYE